MRGTEYNWQCLRQNVIVLFVKSAVKLEFLKYDLKNSVVEIYYIVRRLIMLTCLNTVFPRESI